jgi:hypothetical protein
MALYRLHRLVTLILPLTLAFGGSSLAQAQSLQNSTDSDPGATTFAPAAPSGGLTLDSLVIRGGGLVATFGSGIRLDVTNTQEGTNVSFENDLGFTRTHATGFLDGEWRIGRRSRLYGSWVEVRRDATKTGISQPITIRDTTFQVGATVQAFIDNSYLSFDYGLAILNRPASEIVATFGITSVKVHTGLGLAVQNATTNSVPRTLTTDAEDRSIFPVPGVQFNFKVHPHVTITGYTRYIRATLEGITESSWDGRIGADFPLSSHLGFGGAYYWNRVMEEGTRDTLNGKLTYNFNGPQFYFLAHF